MKKSAWPTTLSAELAKHAGRRRWSRKQTLAVSAAALFLLYAGLLFALRGNAVAASPALPPVQQTEPTPAPNTQAAPAIEGDGTVSSAFLAEYDRLANAEGEEASQEFGADAQSQSGLAGTLTFSLLLIVLAIYGGVWFYKRYMGTAGTNGLAIGGRLLAVQESQSIGPNQKLHLVRMGDELLLIGATDQNISFLARYDSEQVADSFANHLQGAMTPENGPNSGTLDLGEGLERLRGLGRRGFRSGSNG